MNIDWSNPFAIIFIGLAVGVFVVLYGVIVWGLLYERGVGSKCKRCNHYHCYSHMDTMGFLDGLDCSLKVEKWFLTYKNKCPHFTKRVKKYA